MKIFLPLLPVLLDRSPASWHLRSALLPVSSSAPSVLRGYDRLRRLLRAFINQSEGSFRMRLVSRLAIFLTVLVLTPFALAQQPALSPRPITIDDYFRIREVHDPQLSPNAQSVVYVVKTAILKTDKNEERIWMIPRSGGDAIALTAEGVSSSHPRWSPDGKSIAFLSERNDRQTQVWLLGLRGGEAQRLTDTPQDVDDFAWSPDGRCLILVLPDASPEELEAAKEAKDNEGESPKERKKTPKPYVIDRLQFKLDEVGYLDRRRTHLFVFDLAAKSLTQITSGDYDDFEPAWSPDGKLLAFTSNRSKPDPDLTYNSDIWVVAADNVARSAGASPVARSAGASPNDKGAHLTQVTTNPGADTTPAWSPDGKWLTYVTQLDPKLFDYATKHIAISPATGGEAKVLTLAFDRVSITPRFSPGGKFIYFIADDDGAQNVCRVPVSGGEITRPVSGRLMVNDYSLAPTGDLVAQIATIDRPDELFAISTSASEGKLTQITHANDNLMSQLK